MRSLRFLPCLLLAATPAAAGPAALVTDVSGEVSPPVGLFNEIDAGTELTVARGASLTLEHYASCEAATGRSMIWCCPGPPASTAPGWSPTATPAA